MIWGKEYEKRLITADAAAQLVKSGDWVEYGFGINCARDFDEALARRKDELNDVKIRCDIGAYQHFTAEADPSGEHFVWNSWHVSGQDKKFIGKNLYYIPMKFHENPMMTRKDCAPDDVAVLQVTPMDNHGYFNFGGSAVNAFYEGERRFAADHGWLFLPCDVERLGGSAEAAMAGNGQEVRQSVEQVAIHGSEPIRNIVGMSARQLTTMNFRFKTLPAFGRLSP